MKNKVTIKRSELYNQVWSTPMTKLAKEYGLSDVGLAKICKKLNVPRPPVGYWMKLQAGKNVKQTPLPPLEANCVETYTLEWKQSTFPKGLPAKLVESIEQVQEIDIKIPGRIVNYHPLVHEAKIYLSNAHTDHTHMLGNKYQKCIDVRVSKSSLPRALKIMHVLFTELEKKDIPVKNIYNNHTIATCNDQGIRIRLREKSKKNKKTNDRWGGYDLQPLGILSLEIDEYYSENYVRKNFRDTNSKKIDEQIGEFIQSIIKISYYIDQRSKARDLELKKEKEKKQILLDELNKIEQEETKITQLKKDARLFEESEIIRRYVNIRIRKSQQMNLDLDQQKEFDAWVEWSLNIADWSDPTIDGSKIIIDKKEEIIRLLDPYKSIKL